MIVYRIRNFEEYQAHAELMQKVYAARKELEKSLIHKWRKSFKVKGYSYPVNRNVKFHVDYMYGGDHSVPNWRERLVCPMSGLNNRMRAAVQLFDIECAPYVQDHIYISEQVTTLYRHYSSRYRNITGSEFLGDELVPGSINLVGLRHEDLTNLSFPDASFDHILSFDCLEHIPNYRKGFDECSRTLVHGGRLFFSVPFHLNSQQHVTRARVSPDGVVEHFMEPEYHGDPLNQAGCLCFRYYGWDMLEEIKSAGFKDVYAVLYWSRDYGYLGGEQVLFVAKK